MAQSGLTDSCSIQSRLLAETGRHTLSPIFNVGLFLPSGLKLAEGHGSSLRMAEHRAAKNALTSIYTVRGELASPTNWLSSLGGKKEESQYGMDLPTSVHVDFPLRSGFASGDHEKERTFKGNVAISRSEALFGTSARRTKTTV